MSLYKIFILWTKILIKPLQNSAQICTVNNKIMKTSEPDRRNIKRIYYKANRLGCHYTCRFPFCVRQSNMDTHSV